MKTRQGSAVWQGERIDFNETRPVTIVRKFAQAGVKLQVAADKESREYLMAVGGENKAKVGDTGTVTFLPGELADSGWWKFRKDNGLRSSQAVQ